MNNRDIAKVGFAVLAAVMSYNFADTIVLDSVTGIEGNAFFCQEDYRSC